MTYINTQKIAEDLIEEQQDQVINDIMRGRSVDLDPHELVEHIVDDLVSDCRSIISELQDIDLDDVRNELEYELQGEAENDAAGTFDYYIKEDALAAGVSEEDFEVAEKKELERLVEAALEDRVREKVREALGY